jgi:ABC-type transport system involved in cytochrome c biogenesis permease subunit
MKKWLPWIILAVMALWVVSAARPPKDEGFAATEFGRLPVLLNGRVQPLDSVARNSLLAMRSKQSVVLEERQWYEFGKRPQKLTATEWLMETMMNPEAADERPLFRIDHSELQSLLKLPQNEKHFSFTQLRPHVEELERQARRIGDIEAQLRTPFERNVARLHSSMVLYHRLKNSLRWEHSGDFLREIGIYEEAIVPGVRAVRRREAGQEYDEQDFHMILAFLSRYQTMSRIAYPLMVPPKDPEPQRDAWNNVGLSLMESSRNGEIHPAVRFYARMNAAYLENDPAEFNSVLIQYRQWLHERGLQPEIQKGRREFRFNAFAPFYKSMALYVLAFIFAAASWLNWSKWMNRTAFYLVILGWIIHTGGLVTRMLLEGRPPVTNLYSSAVFVGWGAIILGMILERLFRDGIGSVTASSVGFLTLLVAHYLSLDGDTMQMLQAVLDTNFWLATHVIVITLGYSAVFLAGFLGILYVFRGVFTKGLTRQTSQSLARMIYGILCFGILFSFVGTILGGIWADQSWGRFWGWDPKENGALLIVLWLAIILHARWGGLIRERGLVNLAIFGNIVTALSWFGTNMLGIGLHSYGFMDQAFFWLMTFIVSQLAIIGVGLLPFQFWASGRNLTGPPAAAPRENTAAPEAKPA